MMQKVFGKIAVRINQAHAMSKRDVLENQIAQQRGFAAAGLADDIGVMPRVLRQTAKRNVVTPDVTRAEMNQIVVP